MQKPVEGAKKPYSPPRLIVYGTIRELTQANTAGGATDAHPINRFKSHTAL